MVSRLARGASRPFLVGLGAAVSTFGAARAESPAESADTPRAPAVRPLQAHIVFRCVSRPRPLWQRERGRGRLRSETAR